MAHLLLPFYHHPFTLVNKVTIRGEISSLISLAIVETDSGNLTSAQEHVNRARVIAHELSDSRTEAIALLNEGNVLRKQSRLEDALESFRLAKDVFVSLEDDHSVALCEANEGAVLTASGQYDGARSSFEASLEILQGTDDRRGMAIVLNCLGDLSVLVSDPDGATEYLGRAYALFGTLGDLRYQGKTASSLSIAYNSQLKKGEALKWSVTAETALRAAARNGDTVARLQLGAFVACQYGRHEEGCRMLAAAHREGVPEARVAFEQFCSDVAALLTEDEEAELT